MKSPWVVASLAGLLSFWTACRQPVSGRLEQPNPEAVPTGTLESAPAVSLPSPGDTAPTVDGIASEASPSEPMDQTEPEAPPSEPASGPAPVAVEPDEASEPSPGIIPQFKAERPERLTMPVPVFSDDVDFEALVPGWVEFQVQIDATGHVIEAEVVDSSHPDLEAPAKSALELATYTPVKDPRGIPLMVGFRDRVDF